MPGSLTQRWVTLYLEGMGITGYYDTGEAAHEEALLSFL